MTAAILQLVAKGSQDTHLTGNPEITYFKFIFKRHSHFSIENKVLEIDGDSTFKESNIDNQESSKTKFKIPIQKLGDLIHSIYINVHLPKIDLDFDKDQSFQPQFYNSIGHLLIDEVSIEIGGQQIDKHYGEWMEIWSQLSYSEAKQLGFQYMIGRVNSNNTDFYSDKPTGGINLQIPLHFWFCRNIGSALPLVALQYHQVELKITLNPIREVINKGTQCIIGSLINKDKDGSNVQSLVLSPGQFNPPKNTSIVFDNINIGTVKLDDLSFNPSETGISTEAGVQNLQDNLELRGDRKEIAIANPSFANFRGSSNGLDIGNESHQLKDSTSRTINGVPQNSLKTISSLANQVINLEVSDSNQFSNLSFLEDIKVFEARLNDSKNTEIQRTVDRYVEKFISEGSIEISADFIFLDTVERKLMAVKQHNYLIEQIQRVQQIQPKSKLKNNVVKITDFELDLDKLSGGTFKFNISVLNHPVKSLYWFVKPTIHKECYYKFNFSASPVTNYQGQKDPIKNVR